MPHNDSIAVLFSEKLKLEVERGAKELKEADKKLIDVSVASSKRVIAEVINMELGKKAQTQTIP